MAFLFSPWMIPVLWRVAAYASYTGYTKGIVQRRIRMGGRVHEGRWAVYNGIMYMLCGLAVAIGGTITILSIHSSPTP